jgi:predicted RNase H-like HicB family nuclease
MTDIARAEKDKDGVWWIVCQAFPNYVHQCKSHGEADRLKDALNNAYELGKEAKRSEIAEAQGRLDDLLREPLIDYYAEESQ